MNHIQLQVKKTLPMTNLEKLKLIIFISFSFPNAWLNNIFKSLEHIPNKRQHNHSHVRKTLLGNKNTARKR